MQNRTNSRSSTQSIEPNAFSACRVLKRLSISLVLCVVIAALSGCGKDKGIPDSIMKIHEKASPDVLRMGIYGFPSDLNPAGQMNEYSRMLCSMVHAAPLKKLPSGEFVSDLFSDYRFTFDEQNNLIVEGQWRPDLKWHDGKVFEAHEFADSIKLLAEPNSSSPYAEPARKVISVSSFDRGRRTRIIFSGNSRQYLELLALGIVRPVSRETSSNIASESASTPAKTELDPALYPIGLGAFKIKEYKKGYFFLLERVDESAAAPAENAETDFRQILVRGYFGIENLVTDYRAGRLDWISIPSELSEQLEELHIDKTRFIKYLNPSFFFLGFNTKRTPFDDLSFRKAIDCILDRSRIRQQIPYAGRSLWSAPIGEIASAQAGVSGDEIRRLLADSGLGDTDQNGKRLLNGQPFSPKILITQDSLVRKMAAEAAVKELNAWGIDAGVVSVTWSDFFSRHLRTDDFDMFLANYQAPFWGNWVNLWHSNPVLGEVLNFTGIFDPSLDESLNALDRIPAPEDPDIHRKEIGDFLNGQLPGIFLFQPYDVVLISSSLKGISESGDLWEQNPLEWRRKTASE